MPNQFVPPSTPPRVSKPHKPMVMKTPSSFHPVTPVKITETFATPYTGGKNTRSFLKGNSETKNKGNLVPLTPEFTPQRSPHRSHKRKRSTVDAIFKQATVDNNVGTQTPTTDLSGLLMPTPSTVGTGRKVAHNHIRSLKPPVLSFDTLSKLNDNLNFEEEVDDDVFKVSTPQLKSGFIQNTNLKISTNELLPVDASPIKKKSSVRKGLQTPKGQVIDDKTVNRWHGESFNNIFSSDDEDYEEIKPMKMENPFLSTSGASRKPNRPSNPFNSTNGSSSKNGNVDYASQVEYFNTRTGERKVVNLLSRQSQIKPKRLDFSGATDSN